MSKHYIVTKRIYRLGLMTWLLGSMLIVSGQAQQPLPQDLIREVAFSQKLEQYIPLDLPFIDSTTNLVTLGDFFHDKPIILSLGYYECPMLCSLTRVGLLKALQELEAFDVGDEFEVVVVSIDPDETPDVAARTKEITVAEYLRPGSESGWHFLVGQEKVIKALADSVGFQYAYDPRIDEYVHPNGVIILTPEGQIGRYFYGIDFPSQGLRLGLVEAADNKIGSPLDELLLICYHYDPISGTYTLSILAILRVLGTLTVLSIGGFVVTMLRRERHQMSFTE